MALQTAELPRVFRYNSVDLQDPGLQYTAEAVRELYSATYPEIVNAAIEGPEEKDGKLVYTFRRAVGRKGSLSASAGLTYAHWKREAEKRGWPRPPQDPTDEQWVLAWARYWGAMHDYEGRIAAGETDPGRPVVPHRTGRAAAWPFPTGK